MTDSAPAWLATARTLKGTLETPGSADNPVILDWPRQIAQRWPEMADYTRGYTHDAIAWCGLFVAYCVSANGIKPPFGGTDTDKFLWANAWARWGTELDAPRLGCVMVFTRNGGGHVAFYEREDDDYYYVTGGNQSDSVSTARHSKSSLTAAIWPPVAEKLPFAGNIPAPAQSAPSARFETCLKTTLKWEGGNDDDQDDPGGRTSRGILQSEWNTWRQSHPNLPADVFDAPQGQIVAIYRQEYWDRFQCDQFPPGVDLCVFDSRVLSGGAIRFIQRAIGTDVDGEIGPLTIAAAHRSPPQDVINAICDARMSYLRGLPIWSTFGRGWAGRVEDVRATALAQVGAKPQETPMPDTVPTPQVSLDDFGTKFLAFKKEHPEEFAQARQSIGSLVMIGIKVAQVAFPQFAIFGSLAQFVLASAGFMGTPIGEAATSTGQVTGATMVSLLASWAVSKINKVAK